MRPSYLSESALNTMRHETGVVIPVYLLEGRDNATGEALLRDTALAHSQQVSDPTNICLSVDGERFGAESARRIGGEFGVSWCASSANRGKLYDF